MHQLVNISQAVKFTGMSKKEILKALTSYKLLESLCISL